MPSRMASIPTVSRLRKIVERGIVPATERQLLLPFDKLAKSYNRNSPRGVLLRLLEMSHPQMQWEPSSMRNLLATSRRLGGIRLKTKGNFLPGTYSASENKISLGDTRNVAGGRNIAASTAATFFHELQHAKDLHSYPSWSSTQRTTPSWSDAPNSLTESRAMIREVASLNKIFGPDSLPPVSDYEQIMKQKGSEDYYRGAKNAARLIRRINRK